MNTASEQISLAYSPCPNDTFMFCHVANGDLRLPARGIATHLHDVEALNQAALKGTYDVSKLSFHAYLKVRETYQLLNCGAALGFGCGPLVVSREPLSPGAVANARVVVPGQLTTGYLLYQLWQPQSGSVQSVRYDRILTMLQAGEADVGVIIHESRFVYEEAGMHCLQDLGQWWERETGLPIPLGGIVARRSLGDALIAQIDALLKDSIQQALDDPAGVMDHVRPHAQEIDDHVLEQHIRMFVNERSLNLGTEGRDAVTVLEQMAAKAGILS